jgi:hypothetical protein
VLQSGLRWWRRERLARGHAAARRPRQGRVQPPRPAAAESGVEDILAWCRDTLATCRRPWGINHFDLTLDVAATGEAPRRISLSRLDPRDLWAADGLHSRLTALLAAPAATTAPMDISATLFSWGEAAHRALPSAKS